jgi:uncharacterized protein YndB with AHSA1/START domain
LKQGEALVTDRSAIPASFTVEQVVAAAPAKVFHAYSDAETKAKWFGGPPQKGGQMSLDFREGGEEVNVGGPGDGPVYGFYCRFHDIVPNERIVSTYEMTMDGVRISVSLVTTEFKPQGAGTLLVHTEQAVFLDGHDTADIRQGGTVSLLQALADHFKARAAA